MGYPDRFRRHSMLFLRLSPELKEAVFARAQSEDSNASEVVRRLLVLWLNGDVSLAGPRKLDPDVRRLAERLDRLALALDGVREEIGDLQAEHELPMRYVQEARDTGERVHDTLLRLLPEQRRGMLR